jgi:hypothetical protein
MKTNTSKKSIWSADDLHAYLDEAVLSFKMGQHWPQMLTILTSGDKDGDSGLRGVRTYTPTTDEL